MKECEFEIGDLVRLKTGKAPQRVFEVRRSTIEMEFQIRCMYLSDIRYYQSNGEEPDGFNLRRWRSASDYVRYVEEPIQQLPGVIEMPDLYQLKKATDRFGTAMVNSAGQPVRNSQGHMILEMKGENGKVEAFPEDEIELVTPYTVNLVRLSFDGVKNDQQVHMISEAGQVQKDDVLLELNTGHIWRVTALDTKCRSAKENKSKWLKIPTQTIRFGAE